MSKPITLFSGYSQKENRVTNYCLLVLKMIYEENPNYLGEVLSTLVGEEISDKIGVNFKQQVRKGNSIPDGLIVQYPVTIYIETKNFDWFYDSQIESHLDSLAVESPGHNILLALGNFETDTNARFDNIDSLCRTKYKGKISFASISFEDLINALQLPSFPKQLTDAISELRDFLDEENLLPTWKNLLDVVNCAGIPEDVIEGKVYMCPASGGAYSHARCKFFGMYRNKRVERVAIIEAVVDIDKDETESLKWKNINRGKSELIKIARQKVQNLRPDAGPTRVFILGPQYETNFVKDSAGGMLSSKQYFDISSLNVNNAQDLSAKLNGMVWSDLGK